MPGAAAVILAHADPQQVRRLITSLAGLDVFLHCDAKTPDRVCSAMTEAAGTGVHAVPRRRTSLAAGRSSMQSSPASEWRSNGAVPST